MIPEKLERAETERMMEGRAEGRGHRRAESRSQNAARRGLAGSINRKTEIKPVFTMNKLYG